MSEQRIINTADLRKWRTEIPNMYDDAGLDPYEFRLLAHYVRVGTCWEGTRKTADLCRMSIGSVVKKRQSLADKGWITIQERDNNTHMITVNDRWEENFAKYSKCSPGEHLRSPGEHLRSPGELKNQPIKKEPIKKRGERPNFDEMELPQVLKIPEIAVYREVTGRIPGQYQYEVIWETIYEHQFTVDELKPYWREWAGNRGYRANNNGWLTDWAVKGEIPPAGPQQASESSLQEQLEQSGYVHHS